MDIVKAFNSNELHTEITIKGTSTNPLFRASDIGLILEISNIRSTIKDFDETEKDVVVITDSIGRNQEITFLTEIGLYNVLCMSRKPIAKIFKKWVFNVIKEIRLTGEYKLENINRQLTIDNNELQNTLSVSQTTLQTTQTALQKSIRETAVKRHEVLIESNKNKWVVYFCRVKLHEDGSFILKIGETTNIKNRIDALRCDFDPSLIVLDIFICENSIRFEKSLHNHPEILKYKYAKLEHKNKKYSTEAYHIPNQKEYENIVKMVNIEIRKYNSIEFSRLLIEEKKIDLVKSLIPICKNYDEIMNIINKISSPVVIDVDLSVNHLPDQEDAYTHIENVDLVETVASEITSKEAEPENDIVISANSNGPIVQIYHKDDLTQVVQVYDSILEATRNFNYNNKTASFSAIKKAGLQKTIYLDYRWNFIVNRQEPNLDHPRNIGETVITQERSQGQVAMLNITKTQIIKVFKMAKDAAREILQHPSAMCCAIKFLTVLDNHYWMHWDNVDISLQNAYLQLNNLPIKTPNVRGIKIKQLHPITNEVIKVFDSYTDIQKELKISIKKIKELLENNETYKGEYKFQLL